MAQNQQGQVIKSVSQAEVGEQIKVSLSDGALLATVTEKKEAEK